MTPERLRFYGLLTGRDRLKSRRRLGCKPVTRTSGTYDVCGTSTSLGNQCGAGSANNATCPSGGICVDGYCK